MRFEEHLLREIQSTFDKDQKHAEYRKRRSRTREQRNLTKKMFWAAVIVWFVTVIGVLVLAAVAKEVTPEEVPEDTTIIISEPVLEVKTEEVVQPEPEVLEAACVAYSAPEPEPEPVVEEPEPVYYDIKLSRELQDTLRGVCEETGVPFELALAVIWKETNYRNIKGDGGKSHGYMQVQPRWHSDRMERLGVTNLMDPESNFRVGCDFLAELLARHPVANALSYYNSGSTKLSAYAEKVLNYMDSIETENT